MKYSEVKLIIKELVNEFESNKLSEFEIEVDNMRIKLKKETSLDSKNIQIQEKFDNNIYHIKSPLVGTFYNSSSSKDAPFIKVGDQIKKGQSLCIIESMKVMNDIKSPVDGVVDAVLKDNQETVGFDDILFKIKL